MPQIVFHQRKTWTDPAWRDDPDIVEVTLERWFDNGHEQFVLLTEVSFDHGDQVIRTAKAWHPREYGLEWKTVREAISKFDDLVAAHPCSHLAPAPAPVPAQEASF